MHAERRRRRRRRGRPRASEPASSFRSDWLLMTGHATMHPGPAGQRARWVVVFQVKHTRDELVPYIAGVKFAPDKRFRRQPFLLRIGRRRDRASVHALMKPLSSAAGGACFFARLVYRIFAHSRLSTPPLQQRYSDPRRSAGNVFDVRI